MIRGTNRQCLYPSDRTYLRIWHQIEGSNKSESGGRKKRFPRVGPVEKNAQIPEGVEIFRHCNKKLLFQILFWVLRPVFKIRQNFGGFLRFCIFLVRWNWNFWFDWLGSTSTVDIFKVQPCRLHRARFDLLSLQIAKVDFHAILNWFWLLTCYMRWVAECRIL